jgi:hypothetical protein
MTDTSLPSRPGQEDINKTANQETTESLNPQNFPTMTTYQRDGCLQWHHTLFVRSFMDFDELSRQLSLTESNVVVLKRCTRYKQVHYCSVLCQTMNWYSRHRLECKSFGVVSFPSIDVPSVNINDLKNTLLHLSKNFITGDEERKWNPAVYEMTQDIG